jgi:Na+(H+)/acetate symporter ActP
MVSGQIYDNKSSSTGSLAVGGGIANCRRPSSSRAPGASSCCVPSLYSGVPTAQAARKSVIWAMAIIGGFYVLTLFLGTGAAIKLGAPAITSIDRGGNMAAPLLAQYLGGRPGSILGNLMLSFVAAAAFATIVAVVAGLVLAAASAMSHDIWVGVIKGEHAEGGG